MTKITFFQGRTACMAVGRVEEIVTTRLRKGLMRAENAVCNLRRRDCMERGDFRPTWDFSDTGFTAYQSRRVSRKQL